MAGSAASLKLPPGGLEAIADRAAYLHERLACAALGRRNPPGSLSGDDPPAEALLSMWSDSLGGRLEQRLHWDGLQASAARGLLSDCGRQDVAAGWLAALARTLEHAPRVGTNLQREEPSSYYGYLDRTAPVPFEEVLIPFVEAGRERFERDARGVQHLMAPGARITLERALLLALSRLASATLHSEFALYQQLQGGLPWRDESSSRRSYRDFVAGLVCQELPGFLWRYPALARLLSAWVCGWSRSHALLVHRFGADWSTICGQLELADEDCHIDDICPYRSDPHREGQAVSILTLRGGTRLVYKPRALEMEQGFAGLLDWANQRGFSRPYATLRCISGAAHGWMAHAGPTSCTSRAEIETFYIRIGGLLCLVALLQGTDIHHENLVASGSHPFLVDLETLFHPRLFDDERDALGGGSRGAAQDESFGSLLRETGFLPLGSGFVDFSALGATESIVTSFRVRSFEGVNSDRMALVDSPYCAARRGNVPVLHDQLESAAENCAAIFAGFDEMSRLVLHDRKTLLRSDGPLLQFADRSVRFVPRASNSYGLLLQASLEPRYMQHGAARGILFERLRRAALERAERPQCWSLLDAEIHALERMDLPYLSTVLENGAERSAAGCWPSPLRQVIARLERATEAERLCQLEVLRNSLAALAGRNAQPTVAKGESCHE